MRELPWFKAAFGEDYLTRYQHRSAAEAVAAVRLLTAAVGPGDARRAFDLCCGAGRHLSALRDAGWDVSGGDLSSALLRRARTEDPTTKLVQLDMRALPLRSESVALVTNFFTAFGYFDDDNENFGVFGEVRRVLAPGGLFLFDFLNADAARKSLNRTPSEVAAGPRPETSWEIIRSLSADGFRSLKRQSLIEGEQVIKTFTESVRLFSAGELRAGLHRSGFVIESVCGDYSGAIFSEMESPRFIALCRAG